MKQKHSIFTKSLSCLIFALVMMLSVVVSNFKLVEAYAAYSPVDIYSDDFSIAASWSHYQNADDSSVFNGTNAKIDLINGFDSNNLTGLANPTTRSDGSLLDAESSVDNYVLGLFAKDAPNEKSDEAHTKVYNREQMQISGLGKNSYYVLSFYVLTKNAKTTVKLTNSVEYETDPIESDGVWTKYHLFFATLKETYSQLTLNLNYGSYESIGTNATETGYVLYDNIELNQISELDFVSHAINGTAIAANYYSYNPNAERTVALAGIDSDFSSTLNVYEKFEEQASFVEADALLKDWYYYSPEDLTSLNKTNYENAYNAITPGTTDKTYFVAETVNENSVFEVNTFNNDNYYLKLTNKTSDISLGLVSKSFKVDQLACYRVSVMLKSERTTDKAEIMVLSKIKTGANPDGKTFSASVSSAPYTISNEINNNWTEVVVYVRGNAFNDLDAQIVLLCGVNSTVYYDHIRVDKITSTEYSNSTSTQRLDLSPSSALQPETVTNGYFNYGSYEKATLSYPITPSSWSLTSKNYDDAISGIVPTNTSLYYAGSDLETKLGGVANPISSGAHINVLAIYNPSAAPTADDSIYIFTTDSPFSLSANKTMLVTFEVYTANINFSGNIIARLIYNDKTILDFDVNQVAGTSSWTTYTFAVRTSASSQSFKLALGVSKATGTVFFRNVKTTTSLTDYETLLDDNKTWSDQVANNVRLLDFVGDNATAHTTNPIDGKSYYESNNYKVSEVKDDDNNVVSGKTYILNSNNALTVIDENLSLSNTYLSLAEAKTDTVLLLYNNLAKQSLASSLDSMTLSAKSHYKVSLWVKTNESVGDHFKIYINNIDIEFDKVNTTDVIANNGYVQYVAYIETGSSSITTVSVKLALGDANNLVSGFALIRDINFESITAEVYDAETKDLTGQETTVKAKSYVVNTSDEEETTEDNSSKTDEENDDNEKETVNTLAIFFVVFSSLLLVVATIVAIVASRIRKSIKPPIARRDGCFIFCPLCILSHASEIV